MDTSLTSNIDGADNDRVLKEQNFVNHHDRSDALRQVQTAGSVVMSPELFEKLYLSPQTRVKGHLRTTFGNPTPLGVFLFFGGLLMVVGGIMEFILGNTFPFVVFCSFGGFWFAFATTLTPFYNAYGAYSTTDNPVDGLNTAGFNASFGFFLLFFTLLCSIFLICSLRTNAVFVVIFLAVTLALACLVGVYFQAAKGNAALAGRIKVVAGAFAFVAGLAGWYLIAALLLASVDFRLALPVGDLSTIIKGRGHYREENIES